MTQRTATGVLADGTRSTETRKILVERAGSRKARRQRQVVAWLFLAPVVVFLVGFYLYPLFRNIELSLRNYSVSSFITGDAPWAGLGNYAQIVQNTTFLPAIWHTAVFVVLSIAVQFSLGLGLAVFFFSRFPLSSVLRALFLLPWLLPLIVSASTWSWMLNSDSGVVNAILTAVGLGAPHWLTASGWALASVTLANIWLGVPFNLVILYSGLQGIPVEVYEAASLDGAGGWQKFWRITFPLLRPVSAITLLLGLIYTLKVIDIIWVMTNGGPGDASTTLSTWSYQLGFGTALPQFSLSAAVGNLLIIIALVFGLLYIRLQRRLAEA